MTWLPTADVRRLTGRHRFAAMRRELDRRGIRYDLGADGEPLVRVGALDGTPAKARNSGPRWDRIGRRETAT